MTSFYFRQVTYWRASVGHWAVSETLWAEVGCTPERKAAQQRAARTNRMRCLRNIKKYQLLVRASLCQDA